MSHYGICIRAAANMLVAWIPREPHGTSLQNFSPYEEASFYQHGLSFVTSPRLNGVWECYQQKELTQVQATDELWSEDAPGDKLFEWDAALDKDFVY